MTISSTPALPKTFAALAEPFDALAETAVARFAYDASRIDPTFGPHGELAALVRSVTTLEGGLMEQGLRMLLDSNPRFLVIEPVLKLPIIDEAMAAVRSNDFKALAAVRFDAKSYTAVHYRPDLIVLEPAANTAHMIEIKRCSESFGKGYLKSLETKMRAATLVLPHMLFDNGYPGVGKVTMAIVDCEDSDRRVPVIGTSDLDHEFNCPGLGEALGYLRLRFAQKVQARIAACIERGTRVPGAPLAAQKENSGSDVLADETSAPSAMSTAPGSETAPRLGSVTVTLARKHSGRGKGERTISNSVPSPAPQDSPCQPNARALRGKQQFPASISTGKIDPEHPGEDPAAIIAMAVRMGLMGQVDRTGLPAALRDALRDLAEQGEPAAEMVLDWLDRVLLSKLSSDAGSA
ncbi:hypothetical protein [Pelagibacterium sp. H642]|uniref:hypothetical protein n=1 Tax=Pelagibacterium sp. H642 TaxID=1881069 RepID=UPI002815B0E0|nr:hypothetical protein [Pelagibacterium sp. H642]WMT89351.1 hypothetical protein NO934_11075 [Pelagibacterium sp. H642]